MPLVEPTTPVVYSAFWRERVRRMALLQEWIKAGRDTVYEEVRCQTCGALFMSEQLLHLGRHQPVAEFIRWSRCDNCAPEHERDRETQRFAIMLRGLDPDAPAGASGYPESNRCLELGAACSAVGLVFGGLYNVAQQVSLLTSSSPHGYVSYGYVSSCVDDWNGNGWQDASSSPYYGGFATTYGEEPELPQPRAPFKPFKMVEVGQRRSIVADEDES